MTDETKPGWSYDDALSELLGEDDAGDPICVAAVDPSGDLAARGMDVDEIGHQLAAAPLLVATLGDVRAFLVEKYGSSTRVFDRSMWINQTAFRLYERVNAAIQAADGES